MTALIVQRAAHDCSICAIAMALALPYEAVLQESGGCYRPLVGTRNEATILERLGFCQGGHDGEPAGDFTVMDRGILSPDFFRLLAWGRRALVSVPSLNTPQSHHMIYWDGNRVWDPNPGKIYRTFAELLPQELILWREVAE